MNIILTTFFEGPTGFFLLYESKESCTQYISILPSVSVFLIFLPTLRYIIILSQHNLTLFFQMFQLARFWHAHMWPPRFDFKQKPAPHHSGLLFRPHHSLCLWEEECTSPFRLPFKMGKLRTSGVGGVTSFLFLVLPKADLFWPPEDWLSFFETHIFGFSWNLRPPPPPLGGHWGKCPPPGSGGQEGATSKESWCYCALVIEDWPGALGCGIRRRAPAADVIVPTCVEGWWCLHISQWATPKVWIWYMLRTNYALQIFGALS